MYFPGTIRPCVICTRSMSLQNPGVICKTCGRWQHEKCIPKLRKRYRRESLLWNCDICAVKEAKEYLQQEEERSRRNTSHAASEDSRESIFTILTSLQAESSSPQPSPRKRSREDTGPSVVQQASALLRKVKSQKSSVKVTSVESVETNQKVPDADQFNVSLPHLEAESTSPQQKRRVREDASPNTAPVEQPGASKSRSKKKGKKKRRDHREEATDVESNVIVPQLESETSTEHQPSKQLRKKKRKRQEEVRDIVEAYDSMPHLDSEVLPVLESTRTSDISEYPSYHTANITPPLPANGQLAPLSPGQNEPVHVDHVPYNIPDQVQEESLEEAAVDSEVDSPFELAFRVIPNATTRGRDKLVDSRGYGYVFRKENKTSIQWRCEVRTKSVKCGANVVQKDDDFETRGTDHCHPPSIGKDQAPEVMAGVKERAAANIFMSAQAIVTEQIKESIQSGELVPALQAEANLRRTANRVREKMRPADPQDLNFLLQTDFIPADFLVEDIQLENGRRHILFGSPNQLEILSKAKRWYIDGTFHIVRKPFYQLLTVHCFVKKDDVMKQVPLFYAVMSGKETNDYRAVFSALRNALPMRPKVQEVMLDFEVAIWRAIKEVFPEVKCTGCSFHWIQAVWRKCQEIGLQRTYMEKGAAYQLLRELMALPFLPHERIPDMFGKLRQRVQTQMLHELFDYVERTWFRGEWNPEDWTTFMQGVRTNNDVEGWHNRINRRVQGATLAFYRLTTELFTEAGNVDLQMELLSGRKLAKYQRKQAQIMQGRIFKLWKQFNKEERTTESLLRACAYLYGNAPAVR